jgi:hypothetical protein
LHRHWALITAQNCLIPGLVEGRAMVMQPLQSANAA